MYLLISLSDVVQIHPRDFNKPSARCIEDYINTKYADKVIHKVGLCVGFHSIIATSEGLIGHGTGIVNVNVDFRLVVFRPFKGEIMHGTITHTHRTGGVYLSHAFFENIVVPPETLFDGTKWQEDEQDAATFVWRTRDPDSGEMNEFFFDQTEKCLYRVEDEIWHDLSPQMNKPKQNFVAQEEPEGRIVRQTPYLIRGSMALSGLGPTFWWTGDAVERSAEESAGEVNGDAKMVLPS